MTMDTSSCHLTTRDHLILERMATRFSHLDTFYARTLRRKVRDSRLYLRDDIPADVAVLNSWITYQIGGVAFGPHQLVDLTPEDAARDHLSIYSVRGISLLGLEEGTSVVIETPEGAWENMTLTGVQQTFRGPSAASRKSGEVVAFRARNRALPGSPFSPNDDPGPTAA